MSNLGCVSDFWINMKGFWHCRWSLFLSLADLKMCLLLYCFLLHLWCITTPTWHAVLFSSLVVRWWARQIVKNIPPSDMLEVRAKVAALTALSGERKDWGVSRAWERDYLGNVRLTHEQNTNKVESGYSWVPTTFIHIFHLWSTTRHVITLDICFI